jgi:ABC-type xylose transport system permease subunit
VVAAADRRRRPDLLKSRWGNWIFALGGNSDAARAVGVPVMRVRVGLFMTTAAAAWLVGTLTVIRYGKRDRDQRHRPGVPTSSSPPSSADASSPAVRAP